jgi:hypothetical protein
VQAPQFNNSRQKTVLHCLDYACRSVVNQKRDGGVVMSIQESATGAAVVPFAPNKRNPDPTTVVDESGRSIVALLERASDMAKHDCARAMDLAHKLTFQLRAAEERVQELEVEAAHFRECAARAEDWLQHIHREVEQTFFQKKESGGSRQTRKK